MSLKLKYKRIWQATFHFASLRNSASIEHHTCQINKIGQVKTMLNYLANWDRLSFCSYKITTHSHKGKSSAFTHNQYWSIQLQHTFTHNQYWSIQLQHTFTHNQYWSIQLQHTFTHNQYWSIQLQHTCTQTHFTYLVIQLLLTALSLIELNCHMEVYIYIISTFSHYNRANWQLSKTLSYTSTHLIQKTWAFTYTYHN